MIDIVNREVFDPEDVILWDGKVKELYYFETEKNIVSPFRDCLIVENETDISIPTIMFGKLVLGRSPNYAKLLPYKVKVVYMVETNNYWTKHTNYLGIHHEDGTMTLYFRKDVEHSQLSILWILLHEFRHKIQTETQSIMTNLYNSNFDYFMNYLKQKDNTENNINHVFHEIMPYEIDANIFACELLDIKYPGSKFQINDYTMGFLK